MITRQRKYRAQSVLEYTMVVAALAGALLAMYSYVNRSIQGRARDAADEIGEQYSAEHTTSRITQILANRQDVTTTGKPRFITVEVTDKDGKKYTEKREIMESERREPETVIYTGEGSYETTGPLSEEK